MNGQVVHHVKTDQPQTGVDLTHLPQGVQLQNLGGKTRIRCPEIHWPSYRCVVGIRRHGVLLRQGLKLTTT